MYFLMIIDSSNSVEDYRFHARLEGAAACGKCSYACERASTMVGSLGLHLSEPSSLLFKGRYSGPWQNRYEYAVRYWLHSCTNSSLVVFCPPRVLEDR